MFPARAGMSRARAIYPSDDLDVPRASGDEPESARLIGQWVECSPRERG